MVSGEVRALEDVHQADIASADQLDQAGAGPVDLPGAGLTPELGHRLPDLGQAGQAERVTRDSGPPSVLQGMRPPISVAPSSTSFSASPGPQMSSAS